MVISEGVARGAPTPAPQARPWIDIRPCLITLSDNQAILWEVVREEIDFHDGNISQLCIKADVFQDRIKQFVARKTPFTGERTLENFTKYASARHPELSGVVEEVRFLKKRLDEFKTRLGMVALMPEVSIVLWTYLMDKVYTDEVDRKKVAMQFGDNSEVIYRVLSLNPSRKDMIKFESITDEVKRIVTNLDWDEVKSIKLSSNNKQFGTRSVSPKRKKDKVKPEPAVAMDDVQRFKQIADECIERFGSQKQVVNACVKAGIPIRRTMFNLAYSSGQIGRSAVEFIRLAPQLLLKRPAEETVESSKTETLAPPLVNTKTIGDVGQVFIDAHNYHEHDLPLASMEGFRLNFRAFLIGAAEVLNLAIQASPGERQKILAENSDVIDQILNSIQAFKADDPLSILQMLTSITTVKSEQQPLSKPGRPSGGRRKGYRNKP